MTVQIDPEIHSLIPSLTKEERKQLCANLQSDGCREPLVVWKEKNILLDGHNRKEICEQEDISYKTAAVTLADRDAAVVWVAQNQLGRRNLTPEQASDLRGKRYNAEQRQGQRTDLTSPQNEGKSTAKRLATDYGVSRATIERDGQFAAAIDAIAKNVGPSARKKILGRDSPLKKKDVMALAKKPAAKQRAALSNKPQLYTSTSFGWLTPPGIIERVLKVLKAIDLDPCSNAKKNPNVPCKKCFVRDDDGLKHPWRGKVYMNPPYGSELPHWVKHLVSEFKNGNTKEAIALIPSRTDTRWFRLLREYPRCFLFGRLKFSKEDAGATFPSMAVYLGGKPETFVAAFKEIGDIYALWKQ